MVYDNATGESELAYSGGALRFGDFDLETSVANLLLHNARAPVEAVPEGTPLQGWWGDQYDDDNAGPYGSLLWTLAGCVCDETTATKGRDIVRSALKPLVTDKLVKAVDCESQVGDEQIRLVPVITKLNGEVVRLPPVPLFGDT